MRLSFKGIRFKKPEHIPFDLIGTLIGKMTPQQWIELYEMNFQSSYDFMHDNLQKLFIV